MRVGEKETSEQAAIVERYRDLFSTGQLDVLREAEEAAEGDERELLYRLRKTCEAGIVSAELAASEDELENRLLAGACRLRGEELPLRTAQAKLAVLPVYGTATSSARLARRERTLQRRPPRAARSRRGARGGALGEPGSRRPQRRGEGHLAARARARADAAARQSAQAYETLRTAGSSGCSAPTATTSRRRIPRATCAGSRPRADVPEGARGRGLHDDAASARPRRGARCMIRLDLDDRRRSRRARA